MLRRINAVLSLFTAFGQPTVSQLGRYLWPLPPLTTTSSGGLHPRFVRSTACPRFVLVEELT